MNVLLTSVGRRSYLVHYFRQALAGRGRVYAANSLPDAPGMLAAERAFPVPPSHDPAYGETIIGLCRVHGVGLLCPCHDLDVLALAPLRERLEREGVAAVLPSMAWAHLCLDKHACAMRLSEAGFRVPWDALSPAAAAAAVARGEVAFPLVLKARHGYGSLGLVQCSNQEELAWFHRRAVAGLRDSPVWRFVDAAPEEAVLIQEWIDGPELRLVLVNDLAGRPAAHFIAEVHAMRAGESDCATTLAADALGDLPGRLARLTGQPGIWGVDVRLGGDGPVILDLNPRFTGDYPFQHLAGADVPAALVAWARGETPEPAWLHPQAGVTGYKDLVPARAPRPPA